MVIAAGMGVNYAKVDSPWRKWVEESPIWLYHHKIMPISKLICSQILSHQLILHLVFNSATVFLVMHVQDMHWLAALRNVLPLWSLQ
jgi:hypothetical protein